MEYILREIFYIMGMFPKELLLTDSEKSVMPILNTINYEV